MSTCNKSVWCIIIVVPLRYQLPKENVRPLHWVIRHPSFDALLRNPVEVFSVLLFPNLV